MSWGRSYRWLTWLHGVQLCTSAFLFSTWNTEGSLTFTLQMAPQVNKWWAEWCISEILLFKTIKPTWSSCSSHVCKITAPVLVMLWFPEPSLCSVFQWMNLLFLLLFPPEFNQLILAAFIRLLCDELLLRKRVRGGGGSSGSSESLLARLLMPGMKMSTTNRCCQGCCCQNHWFCHF